MFKLCFHLCWHKTGLGWCRFPTAAFFTKGSDNNQSRLWVFRDLRKSLSGNEVHVRMRLHDIKKHKHLCRGTECKQNVALKSVTAVFPVRSLSREPNDKDLPIQRAGFQRGGRRRPDTAALLRTPAPSARSGCLWWGCKPGCSWQGSAPLFQTWAGAVS